MIFWISDRWGQQKDCIGDAIEAIHKDELNGEDSLTLVLPDKRLQKGDRVVWKDRFGAWHEHIVSERTTTHQSGGEYHEYYCENSFAETILDYVDELVAEGVKANVAMTRLLAGTRWQVGSVDDSGLGDFFHFQGSVHEGMAKVIAQWGGEFSTAVAVAGEGVSARSVNLEQMRGADYGKVFTYGHDMDGIRQEVASDDVVTRLHCFGKGTGNGDPEAGYTERLTFESINDGKDYVEDDEAKLLWGLPDGNGGVKHAESAAIFEDCDDETELLELGRAELAKRSHPHVSYSASVAVLSDYGYDYDDARTGDTVWLRDKPLDLRLQGRVTAVTRYLVKTGATVVEMGDTVRSITDVVRQQAADLDWMRARAETWNAAAQSNEAWLERFMANLNSEFDAAGGYVHIDPETGITITNSATNPTMAMQLNGMGFRIANSKNSQQQWNWRTFGTGAGFAADEIVTGKLKCGTNEFDLVNGTITLKNGLIQDTQSRNFWNLATGEMRMVSAGANPKGIILNNGQLSIDGSCITAGTVDAGIITAGILMDSQQNNYWNLTTGYLSTKSGDIGGFTIGQSAIYNGLASLTGQTEGVYLGTNGIACSTAYQVSGSDVQHSIAFSGGGIEGRYNGLLVGYITPNATAYEKDGQGNVTATRHGLQLRGDVLDIRTPHLTVYDANSTSGDSTHTVTVTADTTSSNAGFGTRLIPSSYADNVLNATFRYMYPKYVNGLYIGTSARTNSAIGTSTLHIAMKEYVDAAIGQLESDLKTWVGQQGYVTSGHTHPWGTGITDKPTIPTFTLNGNQLYIHA